MGIVHVAIYDAAVAIYGGYRPYAARGGEGPRRSVAGRRDRDRRARHAHRTAAALGLTAPQQATLDDDYAAYIGGDPGQPGEGRRPRRRQAGRCGDRGAACQRRPRAEPDAGRPQPARGRPRRLAAESRLHAGFAGPAGPRSPTAGDASASAEERLAVPARPAQRADKQAVRGRPPAGQRRSAARTAPSGRWIRRRRRSSGPITTSGNGTTACSGWQPRAGSPSSRRPGCSLWRTSPAATR